MSHTASTRRRLTVGSLARVSVAYLAAYALAAPGARPSARAAAAGARAHKTISTEKVAMIPARPLINLKIDIEYCQYDVYVNGGLVTRNMEGNPAHEDQPINHWLRSGANEIEVLMYLATDEPDTCEIKVALMIKDADNEQAPATTALVLARSAKAAGVDPVAGSTPAGVFDSRRGFHATADKGDFKVGPAELVHLPTHRDPLDVLKRTFDVHLPFPDWAFFKGEKMKQGWEYKTKDELKVGHAEVLAAYQSVWTLLEKHDVDGFVAACDERSREMDLAYYKSSGETRTRLRHELESAQKDTTLTLAPVALPPGKFWRYTVGSKGNLIALTQGSRGSPIFRYEAHDGAAYALGFPVVFRKQGAHYIVTR